MALSLLGAFAAGMATYQHRRFCRSLGQADLPPGYRIGIGPAFGLGVTIAGIVLAIELVL
jgi:hypothetical protein